MSTDYSKTSVVDFYGAIRTSWAPWRTKKSDPEEEAQEAAGEAFNLACAWVEAENVWEVRKLVCRWFDDLESGAANVQYPDPFKSTLSQEEADSLIKELDEEFYREKGRWGSLSVEAGPEFSRLASHARIVFVEELKAVLKSRDEIIEEARERLESGEQLPPNKIREAGKKAEEQTQNAGFGFLFSFVI